MALEMPGAQVHAADLSPDALAVTAKNAELLGASVTLHQGDLFAAVPEIAFDVIVSNPPYIPSGDIPGLDVSVKDFEPHGALDGGEDGLDFYRSVTTLWREALRTGGMLFFEVGIGQADEVLRIMRSVGFGDLEITPDLNGIPRVVEGVLHTEL